MDGDRSASRARCAGGRRELELVSAALTCVDPRHQMHLARFFASSMARPPSKCMSQTKRSRTRIAGEYAPLFGGSALSEREREGAEGVSLRKNQSSSVRT